jgi:type I restriction enzyme S subunit
MNPVFLAALLGSQHAKYKWEMIDRAAEKSGLNFDDIRGFKIIVPPLPLQEHFANLVSKHKRLRAAQMESLRQADHLFETLLNQAFGGNAT